MIQLEAKKKIGIAYFEIQYLCSIFAKSLEAFQQNPLQEDIHRYTCIAQ